MCLELVYKEDYDTYQEAFRRERQLKKWSLAKKEALNVGDIEKLNSTYEVVFRWGRIHIEYR